MTLELLRFVSLQSRVDVSFWGELGNRKLDLYRLSQDQVDITGFLPPCTRPQVSSPLLLDNTSFNQPGSDHVGAHAIPGTLQNFNTMESFLALDKMATLKQVGDQIWEDIRSGAALQSPQLLSRFHLITFADLKAFHFHYWFAFPSLKPPTPFQVSSTTTLVQGLGQEAAEQVMSACDQWRNVRSPRTPLDPPDAAPPPAPGPPFWLIRLDTSSSPPSAEALPLSSWQEAGASWQVPLLAFTDPSHLPEHPGWPLRNLLLLAACHFQVPQVQVVCLRERQGRADAEHSLLLTVELGSVPQEWREGSSGPVAVGWEANAKGALAPRRVDLGPVMDPVRLAAQAVDLNLKLMRWRAAPDLNIDVLAHTSCLLVGAGTLGCAVARTLLAWGVKRITLLDSSRVSFSNPVRQSLFDFQDCLEGGRPKAEAAAEKLRKILPVVESRGVQLRIPMPGHPPANDTQAQQMQQDAQALDALVASHDVTFLLTDTRESRWLPSLLCAAAGKLAITAALGFDTYVVMRHGGPPSPPPGPSATPANTPTDPHPAISSPHHHTPTSRLGCYFCNDVVAPLNSMADRTLDQQCTVARPGLAPIAAAQAVELMAAVLQHSRGVDAPTREATGGAPPALGDVPHMIRGGLSGFQQGCMEGRAFGQCTACSEAVVGEFRRRGWGFLQEAIQDPKALEELTGLTKLQEQAAAMMADSEEDEGGMAADGAGGAGAVEDWTEL